MAILDRRWTIRFFHRDLKGDDRCWVDDYYIYEFLKDSPLIFTKMPPTEEAIKECSLFYRYRRAEFPDPVPEDAIADFVFWDRDLAGKNKEALLEVLLGLQEAALRFRNIRFVEKRSVTIDDDRALYAMLPEKMPADFRLPSEEEFLGEVRAPHAGCPAFWGSHLKLCGARCEHNFHEWGPCTVSE